MPAGASDPGLGAPWGADRRRLRQSNCRRFGSTACSGGREPSLSLGDLRPLLPTVVLERGGGLTGRWLAEFRNLSIAKISLNEMDAGADILAVLHEWMASIESASRRLEGEVAQVQMDDKGEAQRSSSDFPHVRTKTIPFAQSRRRLRSMKTSTSGACACRSGSRQASCLRRIWGRSAQGLFRDRRRDEPRGPIDGGR